MLLKSAAIVAKKVGCQLNAESRSGPGPGPGPGPRPGPESVSIFFSNDAVLGLGLLVNFV